MGMVAVLADAQWFTVQNLILLVFTAFSSNLKFIDLSLGYEEYLLSGSIVSCKFEYFFFIFLFLGQCYLQ